ncbi:acyl-CoA dehydrogenase [Phaeobacter gallaeciensis]|uniref:acyl-CoA dehydrogenase family protein n=1 Tax=Phaeobacter gallaeciensis TaxID=60890 RepID=UPI0023809C2D|nr:acyl-CoA dehydrogenase [Phaeobacter gallaeciensis]MDE4273748.1 acyl-CoA dehydrogenase [Phaeobacter gallaeciensis]MDE4298988.1 acyl-CoA dehydrogenase [Phaeobacter gallaeciensis]MDE5183734.1 acyl-CoA dehydrogenase [Phaeobacter gallaeciensis]
MNFDLTEERQMLQDSLRRFLSDRYTTSVRNDILESETGFSADIWGQLAELGVIGALFSEEDGGFGGAGFDISTVFEELGRAGVVEPLLDTALLGGGLIAALGNDEQKALVEEVIGGAVQLAFAHGEPNSRYELSRVETTAQAEGDQIVLNGRKAVVVNAEAADHLVISARESGAADATDGISLFLVPRDAEGLSLRGYALLAGGRAAEVELDNLRLPASVRLGDAGAAWSAMAGVFARAEVALAAETLGAMETATELTRQYLLTRSQFGRPIGTFQALQHRVADLLIEIEQARSAVINAAGHLEGDARMRDLNVAAARNLIGRAGRLVAEDSIQLHGGIAMTQEYELAHIAKRIVMAEHRFGDADTQLERFLDLSAA